ncbi:hypothetical protein AAFF_G00352540 [Aldrovandia affinis]|uniref:Uncharacterized protein n=1 Tax=Aldrovandia affinis TaxID=143900 RepID=A0AAD7WNI9_9TELE|nr:hypothetical protein AAFF_G00352540 [Aldrovandia affinis]
MAALSRSLILSKPNGTIIPKCGALGPGLPLSDSRAGESALSEGPSSFCVTALLIAAIVVAVAVATGRAPPIRCVTRDGTAADTQTAENERTRFTHVRRTPGLAMRSGG